MRHPLTKKTRRALLEALEPRTLLSTVSVTGGFSGIGNTGETFPSTNVAVGPNYVVETADPAYAIFDKSTGAKISQVPLHTLFSGFATGTSDMFNSQVLYDDQAGRFIIATQVQDAVNYKSWVDIAVSNTSDPTQGFTEKHQIEVDNGGLVWSDDGKLGYNADGYVFVGNMAQFTSAGTSGQLILTINKSTVLDQNNSTFTDYPVYKWWPSPYVALVPARMHGSAPGGPMWFVDTLGSNGNAILVTRMDNELSPTPTLTNFYVPANPYMQSLNPAQPAGYVAGLLVNDVEADDCRALDVEWNNNNLVAAFNGAVSDTNLDAAAHWIQFNTAGASPAVVQQGVIHPGAGIGTYYPAVAVDANGDLGFEYQESSATEYISMYVTGRLASDPAGTMQTPVRAVAGSNTISWRQGDYSGISLDPSSPNTFWAGNEYGLNFWSTWIAKFQIVSSGGTTNLAPTVATPASASQSTVTGTTTNLSVLGADDGGESTLTYTWATTGTPPAAVSFSANGSNAAKNTAATFTKAGSYNFQVTITDTGGLSTTSSVTVTVNQTLTSISVSPATASLNENQARQFTALANDQFGNALLTQPAFTWGLIGPGVLSTTGLYTAPGAAGSASISAASGAVTGSASVAVSNAVPTVATPASASSSPVSGTSTALTVLGADDGGESNLTYTWATTGTPPAPVSFSVNGTNAAKNTTATFAQAGAYSFQVTVTDSGGLSTTSSVTVTVSQTLTSISVSPAIASLNENQARQFTATGYDQFGNALLIQPALTWGLIGPGVLSTAGLYTAPGAAGTATITAASGVVSGSASVAVNNAVPTIATPASGSPNPVTGTTANLSVLGADDGGESNLAYRWSTTGTPPAPVSFSANGSNAAKNTTATFTQAGTYSFLVTITDSGGLSTTSGVAVTVNQTLTSVSVLPGTVSLAENSTQQFTATAADQFGKTMAVQPTFTWSVASGVGSIDSLGLYTAPLSTGSATVRASGGGLSANASITVVSAGPTLVTPASASPDPVTGTTTALSVLGADPAGESSLTYSWSVLSAPAGAPTPTFSDNGTNTAKNTTATFFAAGNYTFQVILTDPAGLTATSSVSLTVNQTLTGVSVSPGNATVPDGAAQQFTATAWDQFGNPLTSQPSFSWSLSGLGTLDATGLYTAPASGSGSAIVSAAVGQTATSTSGFSPAITTAASVGSISAAATVTVAPLPASINLVATVVSSTKVTLSWTDSAGNATSYYVLRSANGGTWSKLASLSASSSAYNDTHISAGCTYCYEIQANSSAGPTFSNTAGVTLAPKAPGGLSVKQTTSSQIKLAWSDVTGETGFIIERSLDGVNWVQAGTTAAKVLCFQDTGLNPSTLYCYRVRAMNAGGTSAASSVVKATTAAAAPIAPSGLIAVAISSTQVNLSWTDNSTNESGFRVFRSSDGGQTWAQIVQLGSSLTAYADTSVASGTTYLYKVVAYNSVGTSAYSNVAQVTT